MHAGNNDPFEPTTGDTSKRRFSWRRNIALGLFIAFGGLIALVIAIDWLQGVSTYFWDEGMCTIESSSVVERSANNEFELVVSYRYYVRGESFTGSDYRHGYTGSSSLADAHRLAARYAVGESVSCWIDADEPWKASLRRANLWRGLWILIPLFIIAIPAGILYALNRPADAQSSTGGGAAKPIKTSVVMLVLFGAFFLFGFGMFIPFFVQPALQVVEARFWTPMPCEIVSSGVRSHRGDDSTTYSVEAVYRYRVDGAEYVSNRYQFMTGSSSGYDRKAEAAAAIPAGSQVECYVDPDDPYEAVIHRGFALDFLFGLIPLVFGVIGAVGLAFAIHVTRAAKRDAARPSWIQPPVAPATVAVGPLELEPSFGPVAKVGCTLFLAAFWNGIVSVFVWQLVGEWSKGRPDWLLALFLTPFVLIGLLLLSGIPYSLLALLNPRPRLRLARRALRAGENVQLDWSFRGAASRIEGLKIWLECSQRETERTESSVSTSTSVIREIEVLDRGAGMPVEFGSTAINLPDDVLPTSEGDQAVSWTLKLHGRINNWPDVHEQFDVRVEPPR